MFELSLWADFIVIGYLGGRERKVSNNKLSLGMGRGAPIDLIEMRFARIDNGE